MTKHRSHEAVDWDDPRFRKIGWRARIGVITPFAGMAVASDFHKIAPEGVALVLATVPRPLIQDTVQELREVGNQVAEAARRLVRPKANTILWNTSSGSLIGGVGYDHELIRAMEEASHIPATTASTAMIQAFRKVGATSVALATPYIDEINELEKRFIEGHGFRVPNYRGLQLLEAGDIVDVSAAALYQLAKQADHPDADCIFISNAGFSALEILGILESELGKPVLSTNQVSLWGAFKLAQIPLSTHGFGSLLEAP